MTLIRTERRDTVGILTLDHPQRRNALSRRMVDEIIAALADFGRERLRSSSCVRPPAAPSGRLAMTCTSCRIPAAIRSAGTTHCGI
jgi:hypothetical protein